MVTSHSHRYVSLISHIHHCSLHLSLALFFIYIYLLYGYIIASSFLFIVLSTPKYFVCLYLIYCCYFSATSSHHLFIYIVHSTPKYFVCVCLCLCLLNSLQISIHSAVGNKMLLSACKFILMGGMVKGDMPGGLGSMGLTMSDGMGGGCMNGG